MVITITMRNYRIRNGIYWFRIVVPEDCRAAIGKDEISFSLDTSDQQEAAVLIPPHTKKWKKKFKEIRDQASAPVAPSSITIAGTVDFKEQLSTYLNQNLAGYIDARTDEELHEAVRKCRNSISLIRKGSDKAVDLKEELNITLPLPKQGSPGMTRRFNKVVISCLEQIITEIENEVGQKQSPFAAKLMTGVSVPSSGSASTHEPVRGDQPQSGMDITEVMSLMFKAKGTDPKFKNRIEVEVSCLMDWCGGKFDITEYSKSDLIDYIHSCLPYIPARMSQKKVYEGKTLRECVDMVKGDVNKYEPISFKTCENRYAGLQSVFTYAKNQLGLIAINPASGISIPVIRTVATDDRAFSEDELTTIWTKILPEAHDVIGKYPERYWSAVLSLYHGFRQNEVCSLKIKDVFLDSDGIYVIRIQEELGVKGKSTKTVSSNRVVPIHPYVLNELDFTAYVDKRRSEGKVDDMLFPNVTYVEGANFGRKVSRWFNKQKKELLPVEVHHKNFHSLRHTFIQQAQNQAKMPDRYNQEITGHAVQGISSVHLGYSGRLKPKDLLVELSKVKYGWE